MGTFRSTFKPQYSAGRADRAHTAPAVAKAKSLEPEPKLKPAALPVERVPKARKAAASSVLNPSSVINPTAARKRGRPIKSNDTAHQQARERARRYRARKVIAQTVKVTS